MIKISIEYSLRRLLVLLDIANKLKINHQFILSTDHGQILKEIQKIHRCRTFKGLGTTKIGEMHYKTASFAFQQSALRKEKTETSS